MEKLGGTYFAGRPPGKIEVAV